MFVIEKHLMITITDNKLKQLGVKLLSQAANKMLSNETLKLDQLKP
jgi:hypothetical protein